MEKKCKIHHNLEKFDEFQIKKQLNISDYEFSSKNKKDIIFYMMGAYYTYSEKFGTIIHINGNLDKNDNPIHLQVHGFSPHFYIRIPSNWTRKHVDELCLALNAAIIDNVKNSKSKETRELQNIVKNREANHAGVLIKNWAVIEAEEFAPYTGESTSNFIDVTLEHPKFVRIARSLIDDKNNCSWHPHFITNDLKSPIITTFESDIDFIIRFLIDKKFKPCTWFQIDAKNYNLIEEQKITPGNNHDKYTLKRESNCELEVMVKCDDIIPINNDEEDDYDEEKKKKDEEYKKKIPDLTIAAFDIECLTSGLMFPTAEIDPVLQISVILWNRELGNNYKRYLFALKETDEIKGNDHVFWYDHEIDMIRNFRKFILSVDPDVLTHHNGSLFDFPYLLKRSKQLGLENFDKLGRSMYRGIYTKTQVVKHFERGTITIPGRINLDIMTKANQDDPKLEEANLPSLSKKYLKGDTKEEFLIELIAMCQRTKEGRTRMGRYCMKDSFLVMEILRKRKMLLTSLATSKLCNVTVQTILDRSLGAKVQGLLLRECNKTVKIEDNKRIKLKKKLKMSKNINDYSKNKSDQTKNNKDDEYDDELIFSGGGRSAQNLSKKSDSTKTKTTTNSTVKKIKYKGATVLAPVAGAYDYCKVVCLDFSSMYPSIMILKNLCFLTLVTDETIEKLGLKEGEDYWRLPEYVIEHDEFISKKDPNRPAFLLPHIKKGLIPEVETSLKIYRTLIRMEAELVVSKIETLKQKLKTIKTNGIEEKKLKEKLEDEIFELELEYDILDATQLAIKIIMNGIYGITGDETSPYHLEEIASTVTGEGRGMIMKIKFETERKFQKKNGYYFNTEVIYGDTDSIFVAILDAIVSVPEASTLGGIMASYITLNFFKPPVKLDFEKVYTNLVLIKSKHYYGTKWLITQENPILEIKGLEMIKRGDCLYIKETCKKAIEKYCLENDLDGALKYIQERRELLKNQDVLIFQLIEKKKIGKLIEEYGREIKVIDKKTGRESVKKGGIPPIVALSLREWEKEKLIAKQKNLPVPKPAKPGTIVTYVNIKISNGNSKSKGDSIESALKVLRDDIPIDYDCYLKDLDKRLLKYFGMQIFKKFSGNNVFQEKENLKQRKFKFNINGKRKIKEKDDE